MDLKTKCEINVKLDYEGGYKYLIFGNSFAGIDPHFDKLVKELSHVWRAIESFLGSLNDCEDVDGD